MSDESEGSTETAHAIVAREHRRVGDYVVLVVGLAICTAGFWFETRRALGGNALSWAYVVEWPFLGAYGVYAWIRMGRNQRKAWQAATAPTVAPEHVGMLLAWQESQERERAARLQSALNQNVDGGDVEASRDRADTPPMSPS